MCSAKDKGSSVASLSLMFVFQPLKKDLFFPALVGHPTDTLHLLDCPTFEGVDLSHYKMTSAVIFCKTNRAFANLPPESDPYSCLITVAG